MTATSSEEDIQVHVLYYSVLFTIKNAVTLGVLDFAGDKFGLDMVAVLLVCLKSEGSMHYVGNLMYTKQISLMCESVKYLRKLRSVFNVI